MESPGTSLGTETNLVNVFVTGTNPMANLVQHFVKLAVFVDVADVRRVNLPVRIQVAFFVAAVVVG